MQNKKKKKPYYLNKINFDFYFLFFFLSYITTYSIFWLVSTVFETN